MGIFMHLFSPWLNVSKLCFCSFGLTKTLDFILRFLAMVKLNQASLYPFGLTKTLDFNKRKEGSTVPHDLGEQKNPFSYLLYANGGFILIYHLAFSYSCSSIRVFVGWSQTSAGPKYWIGPG